MVYVVAVTDSPAADLSVERRILDGMRVMKVDWHDQESLIEAIRNADAILCMHAPLNAAVIQSLRRCRAIARFGTGLDNIDTHAAAVAGIPVLNIADYCTEEVATHTIALLLSWHRKILDYHTFVWERRWNERQHTTGNWGCGPLTRLSRQTLGLVGFGRIAQAVARRAQAMSMPMLAWSRRPDRQAAAKLNVTLVSLDELWRQSDYVSLHIPLTDDTRHLVDSPAIATMKPGAVVINTSRGGLVDEQALAEALAEGRLGGALLDVYEQAPLPVDHPFRMLHNVILTPHVGFFSEESLLDLRRLTAESISRHLPPP